MSVDVVCAGVPFLDITFSGMARMPELGEERMAERVTFTPGGLANVALGLTRLGLRAALWSPRGDDMGGRLLAELLEAAGIAWVGPRTDESAVSAILPLNGDNAVYLLLARNLATGAPYNNAGFPWGYPVLLAPGAALFGPTHLLEAIPG